MKSPGADMWLPPTPQELLAKCPFDGHARTTMLPWRFSSMEGCLIPVAETCPVTTPVAVPTAHLWSQRLHGVERSCAPGAERYAW